MVVVLVVEEEACQTTTIVESTWSFHMVNFM